MKKGPVLLLITALIWGFAFVAQSVAMDVIGPWTFNAIRGLVAGVSLFVIGLLFRLYKKLPEGKTVRAGIVAGVVLTCGSMLQQYGIVYTTVSKAGFITSLYVVIVPIIENFFIRKADKKIWICVLLSIVGLYLLCMKDRFVLQKGDLLVLLCAFTFALHIIVIDHYASDADPIQLSCIQFITMGVLCFPGMMIEKPTLTSLFDALVPLLYASLFSSCIGYTFQSVAQKSTPAYIVSLLLSLESAFAAFGGYFLLHQSLSQKEIIGCVCMFAAVILAELPTKQSRMIKQKRST